MRGRLADFNVHVFNGTKCAIVATQVLVTAPPSFLLFVSDLL